MENVSPIEAVIVTEQEGLKFSIYDTHTGTSIVHFQNQEPINENCLHVINNTHFITAHTNKLHVWSIYNRRCQDQKLFLPGSPTCLTISPCAGYLAAGVSDNIFIWQIHSGYLMSCVSAHYQSLTQIKFNRDGTILFTASRDGSVMVWSVADLIAKTNNIGPLNQKNIYHKINNKGIRFIWQHHSGPVTAIEVTYGGLCVSVSEDSSANIYNYHNGKRLGNVVFPTQIYSVIIDKNETTSFMGGLDGNVYQLALSNLSIAYNFDGGNSSSQKPIFEGHKEKVNLMQLSFDGTKLITCSRDNSCKFWDVPRRKLLREILLKSCPQNLVSILVPEGLSLMTMTSNKPLPFDIKPLTRNVYNHPPDIPVSAESFLEECSTTIMRKKNNASKWELGLSRICKADILKNETSSSSDVSVEKSTRNTGDPHELVENLRQKIEKIYNVKVETILNSVSNGSN